MNLLIAELFILLPAVFASLCNNRPRCENGNACCQSTDNTQWCCLQPTAVCCDERYGCCPEGYSCIPSRQRCIKLGDQGKNLSMELDFQIGSPLKVLQLSAVTGNICPDGVLNCPDNYTCCITSTGYQCCPASTTCIMQKRICVDKHNEGSLAIKTAKKNSSVDLSAMISITKVASPLKVVQCNDSQFFCPDGSTCCPVSNSKWMCCPMLNATCCSDNYCCPNGMKCDAERQTCIFNDLSVSWIRKRPAQKLALVKDIICPGRVERCPDLNTCCPVGNSTYGCCPYAAAMCCSDFKHCCPSGTECDVVEKKCLLPPNRAVSKKSFIYKVTNTQIWT